MRKQNATPSRDEHDGDTRGDRTRRLIKQTIARIAMRKDIAEINLAEICQAAKLTTGAVYFHFKGKEEAIEEMVIDEVQSVYARIIDAVNGKPFNAAIGLILEESAALHRRRKRLPRAIQVTLNTRPRAYEAWLAARHPLIDLLEAAIASERSAKGLETESARYLAYFILNSIEDLAMDVFQWQNPTLSPFATSAQDWNVRQRALWSWAILAPFPDGAAA